MIKKLFKKLQLFFLLRHKKLTVSSIDLEINLQSKQVKELSWFARRNNLLEEFYDEDSLKEDSIFEDEKIIYPDGDKDISTTIKENKDKVHTFDIPESKTIMIKINL